jgi:hypothetical protein
VLLLLLDTFHKALGCFQEGKDNAMDDCMDQTYSLEGSILEMDKVDNARDADLEETFVVADGDIVEEDTSVTKTN